eukprot:12835025-Alexandrium_andersonii.AAC.1
MLVEKAGTALQLSPIELGHDLQAGPRGGHAPGDVLLAHPRAIRVDGQAAPIRARRAANKQERPARGDESGRLLAVARYRTFGGRHPSSSGSAIA